MSFIITSITPRQLNLSLLPDVMIIFVGSKLLHARPNNRIKLFSSKDHRVDRFANRMNGWSLELKLIEWYNSKLAVRLICYFVDGVKCYFSVGYMDVELMDRLRTDQRSRLIDPAKNVYSIKFQIPHDSRTQKPKLWLAQKKNDCYNRINRNKNKTALQLSPKAFVVKTSFSWTILEWTSFFHKSTYVMHLVFCNRKPKD